MIFVVFVVLVDFVFSRLVSRPERVVLVTCPRFRSDTVYHFLRFLTSYDRPGPRHVSENFSNFHENY